MQKPRVAIVRGRYLNRFELQSFEPLLPHYDQVGFASLTSIHRQFPIPVHYLPSPVDAAFVLAKFHIPPRISLGLLNRVFVDAQYLWGLEKELKGFDIAHTADTFYHFTQQALNAKQKGYIKKVVATVWENIPYNHESIRGRKEFKRRALREVDQFIAVTKQARDALIKEGCNPKKITLIYPGIDLARFKPRQRKHNSKNILYVGRLVKEKGIWTIFDAFKTLLEKNPSLQLRFCGSGEEERSLRKAIAHDGLQQAVIIQPASYEEMPRVYQNADIFVLASESTKHWQEQFGMVLIEAMAAGLPTIATRSGAIPEVVGNAGLIVKEKDAKEFARAMNLLLHNTAVRAAYSKNGQKRVRRLFDRQKTAKKFFKVYQEMVASPSRTRSTKLLARS